MKQKLLRLEALRGLAALYVFAGHLALERMTPKSDWAGFVFRFGQEAVMLFFILSGFVVYYSTQANIGITFSNYFWRRFKRIFPIFWVAILLSYISQRLLLGAVPNHEFKELIGNLCMLQDFRYAKPGVWFEPVFGNNPLWSLSYEWWFYMMFFPIYRIVREQSQIHVVAGISGLGWISYNICPNQLSLFLAYFIVWWNGVELARRYLSHLPITLSSQRVSLFYTGFFAMGAASPVWSLLRSHGQLIFGVHPILEMRHFLAASCMLICGIVWSRYGWIGFGVLRVFAVISPISYALYVFHYPVAVTSNYLAGIPSVGVQLLGYTLITFLLAWLAEFPFQRAVNRAFMRWTSSRT